MRSAQLVGNVLDDFLSIDQDALNDEACLLQEHAQLHGVTLADDILRALIGRLYFPSEG